MRILATLIIATVAGVPGVAAEPPDPRITAVIFERCSTTGKCSEMTRWSELTMRTPPPSDVRVVATIVNSASYGDEYFLLTTTEYMVAPLYAYSAADFETLKTRGDLSWTQLTQDDDMRTFILHDLRRETRRAVPVRRLDLRKVLKGSFSEPDVMWPWLVRVTAILIDRQGRTISTQSGILPLAPSAGREKALSDPPGKP
jgi:hypothetical protein